MLGVKVWEPAGQSKRAVSEAGSAALQPSPPTAGAHVAGVLITVV